MGTVGALLHTRRHRGASPGGTHCLCAPQTHHVFMPRFTNSAECPEENHITHGRPLHPPLRHTAFMFDRSHVVLIAPLFILVCSILHEISTRTPCTSPQQGCATSVPLVRLSGQRGPDVALGVQAAAHHHHHGPQHTASTPSVPLGRSHQQGLHAVFETRNYPKFFSC